MKTVYRSNIKQKNIHFFNYEKVTFQDDIWDELEQGLWQQYNIENRLYNENLGETKQVEWKKVFPDITPIYPGFLFNIETLKLYEDRYIPKYIPEATLKTFLQKAESYFHAFDGKKIGVHLSGGLDSSLIICLLKYFKIPFVLVGLSSSRFEFRTEHQVQLRLSDYGENTTLLDFEEFPYFYHLEQTPKHQYPDSCLKSNYSSLQMIEAYKRAGCDVVFSGQGGDSILVKSFDHLKDYGLNINNEMTLPWEEDLLYRPSGLELKSFFAEKDIIDQLYSLRYNQKEDTRKEWARSFFKSFLPQELSSFCYCADFYALCLSGLYAACPTIARLYEEAEDISKSAYFSKKETDKLLKTDIYAFTHKLFWETCSRISIAVWLHSLFRQDD